MALNGRVEKLDGIREASNRLLKNSFSRRLFKKAQVQGAVTHPHGWVPAEARGVISTYGASPRERGGTHRRWVTADGPFSAAC